MSPTIPDRLRSLLADDEGQTDADERRETTLRACPDCGTTYIGAVETCSDCGSDLEETPTERDLGLL